MDSFSTPVETTPESARKRKRQPEKWKSTVKANERKKLLYSAKGGPGPIKCSHTKNRECSCSELSDEDIREFHTVFYAIPDKQKQDALILKYVSEIPKRKRKQDPALNGASTRTYRIVSIDGKEHLVCRNTFLSVLQLKISRVLGVFKRFKSGNAVPVERRGGWKEALFAQRLEAVIAFIKQLKGVESHYAREKSSRIYLPSELSRAQLHKMYLNSVGDQDSLKVKLDYFRHVFNTKFNLRFGAPSTDECSMCIELDERLEVEKNTEIINDLKTKKTLHKNQAVACFFEKLEKKPADCLLLSFDFQKNLVLPKVSDQTAYFSRRLYCYNLAVVSGSQLSQENVSLYTWTEDQARKSSSEVASIVFNELEEKIAGFKRVRLVAEGCAGQNKNVNLLTMCARWLLKAQNDVKKIELVFPVTGHSFMPASRVLGLIDKELRRKTTIIDPSEYHEIFKRYGTVKIIGQDWMPYDWKSEATQIMKSAAELHFQIKKCKRFLISKTAEKNNVLISGELAYNVDSGEAKICSKKDKSPSEINPKRLDLGVPVNALKARDVKDLLQKRYGDNWDSIHSLQYYKSVLLSLSSTTTDEVDNCECFADPDCDDMVIALMTCADD